MEQQLISHLQKIYSVSKQKNIKEKDLELLIYNPRRRQSLLHLLGYSSDEVKIKPPIEHEGIGTPWFRPDYMIYRKGQPSIAFDLKAPRINLDNAKPIRQIVSYIEVTCAPFGVLYNGKSLRVFANTQLTRFKSLQSVQYPSVTYKNHTAPKKEKKVLSFRYHPIAIGDMAEEQKITAILLCLAKESLKNGEWLSARQLAKQRSEEIARDAAYKQWQKALCSRIETIRNQPTEEVLRAIKSIDTGLASLNPTMGELKENWNPKPELTKAQLAALKAVATRQAKAAKANK